MRPPSFVLGLLMFVTVAAGYQRSQKCRIQPPFHLHKAVAITLTDAAQLDLLQRVLLEYCEVFLLSGDAIRLNHVTKLLVTAQQYDALQDHQLLFPPMFVISDDVEATLASSPKQRSGYTRTNFATSRTDSSRVQVDNMFYSQYSTYNDLLAKWANITYLYAPHVKHEILGKSTEGRDIVLLRIGRTDSDDPKRVFLNGLQHAREWIAAHVPTYIAEVLAFNAAEGTSDVAHLLKSVEVLIVAAVNPDGYEFSRKTSRLHRKSRRDGGCGQPMLDGVDLNRNWGKDFGGEHSTSVDPCEELYRGTKEFSETETQLLRKLVMDSSGIKAHVDFHSFGQLVLGAWSYIENPPPHAAESERVGLILKGAMSSVNGQTYTFGNGAKTLYPASGVMSDWITEQGILSYTIELRPAFSFTLLGFELPERQILQTCEEGLAVGKTLLKYAGDPKSLASEAPEPTPKPVILQDTEEGTSGPAIDVPFIVGVSTGGLVVVALVLLIIFVVRRSKRRAAERCDAGKSSTLESIENGVCVSSNVPTPSTSASRLFPVTPKPEAIQNAKISSNALPGQS